jgi:hypothetical protein
MLSLLEFSVLPNPEKLNYIVEKGRFIINNTDNRFLIALYATEQFFVKIWYDTRIDTVHQIEAYRTAPVADTLPKHVVARGVSVGAPLN